MAVRRRSTATAAVAVALLASAAAQHRPEPEGGTSCALDCGSAGRCVSGQCVCDAGFTGAACEIDIDTCRFDPCYHGGVCVDGVNSFTCRCPTGFTGIACQVDVDECASGPCLNGAACLDSYVSRRIAGDQYWCECAAGFAGEECELQVNACAARPCERGHCVNNLGGGFACACRFGWAGDTCEVLSWQLPFIGGAGLIVAVFVMFDVFDSLWGKVERAHERASKNGEAFSVSHTQFPSQLDFQGGS